MIIPSIQEIRDLDRYTIENEPISSIDLMERASESFCEAYLNLEKRFNSILVVCGPGNNGGDGLAIARILSDKGINVDISIINPEKGTEDFKTNLNRVPSGVPIHDLKDKNELISLNDYDCIIDGVFGSGLNRSAGGFFKSVIDWINQQRSFVVSIDIPSGLFGDQPNTPEDPIVKADVTISFQFPKLSYFLPQQGNFVGELIVVDIGILPEAITKVESTLELFSKETAHSMYKSRKRFSHKGTYGHGLLISGSLGKMGAAALSGKAALRAGLGLLTIHSPKTGVAILQETLNEAMVSEDEGTEFIRSVPNLDNFNSLAIGPGLGTGEETAGMFEELLKEASFPLVIDADAINLLAANPSFLDLIPKGSILTPHPGEFRRLVGNWESDYERLEFQKSLAQDLECYVLVKGAYSTVASPDGKMFFNSSGNPGMATAGSGDVLTGIILGLLGQGYTSEESIKLSVFLHGLSGDFAAMEKGYEGLIASDLVEMLPIAFKKLY